MSAPKLPSARSDSASYPSNADAAQRAREIQAALKSIVLQTAATLRARMQLARLQSSVPSSSAAAAASVNEASSSVERLAGDCAQYLSLVHGLRDYLLHAQAALEIELEAATQREAEEAKKAAEAAAEAIRRQQQAEEEAKKKAEEDAERKRVEEEERAAKVVTDTGMKEGEDVTEADQTKSQDADISGLRTPPLPTAMGVVAVPNQVGTDEAKKNDMGKVASDAIVIDSDGDDDEDDVPLAFAPKTGAADSASKAIDLTDSPAFTQVANPLATVASSTAAGAAAPLADVGSTGPSATQETSSSSSSATAAAAAAGVPGLDLSAFGINLSSLTNLPDLSSLGIPSLTSTTTSATDPSSLAPAADFSELEKMMGIDSSSSSTSQPASVPNATSTGAPDLSLLSNFNMGGSGGFGEDNDMFGSGTGGLDLSNFDFSALTGGMGGDSTGASGSGGVDLSSFLTNFTPSGETEGDKDNTGS